jgi:hypothetical protein
LQSILEELKVLREELNAWRDERNPYQAVYTSMTRDFMQMQNEYKGNVYGNLSGMEYLLKNPPGSLIFAPELEQLICRIMEKKTMEALEKDVDWMYEKRMPSKWPTRAEEFARRLHKVEEETIKFDEITLKGD